MGLKNFTLKFYGGSSPLLCRKYLRSCFPDFQKIYAHKWLCTAVCGHNIFFVNVRWLSTTKNIFSTNYFPKIFYIVLPICSEQIAGQRRVGFCLFQIYNNIFNVNCQDVFCMFLYICLFQQKLYSLIENCP